MIQKLIFLTFLSLSLVSKSQSSRSYVENEIIGQSVQEPISEVPLHAGTWVEWDSTGNNIIMMDGSIWKKTKSLDRNVHYRYVGTNNQPEQFTQYIEAVFNSDYTEMNIRYNFGPMGMAIPMVSKSACLGEGKKLAEEWINMPDEE